MGIVAFRKTEGSSERALILSTSHSCKGYGYAARRWRRISFGKQALIARDTMVSDFTVLPAERFAQNRLFEGIDRETIEELTAGIEVSSFEKDDVIFREGDRGELLYLVGEGSVKISKQGRGGQQETLGFIEPGNFFGEMALLDNEPRSAMAVAARHTLLGLVNETTFQRILENAPSRLHLNFLRSVTDRLRQINSHFISEVMRTERLSMVGAMASMIIHDLNNPISTVRCCCDVIARESSDPTLLEATALLDGAVNGMLAMTQELLDFTRGSIALKKEQIRVDILLRELAEQSRTFLRERDVRLCERIAYGGEIEVDANRFLRVLSNLVKNAWEAMPTGGTIKIDTQLLGNEVVFQIADTGVGIPPEILPRLFEPFVTHGKASGTGLGMAIAKSVVEAHQGKISVESKIGEGTTVQIRLPAPPPLF
jgi:signal transduction histidine kinase